MRQIWDSPQNIDFFIFFLSGMIASLEIILFWSWKRIWKVWTIYPAAFGIEKSSKGNITRLSLGQIRLPFTQLSSNASPTPKTKQSETKQSCTASQFAKSAWNFAPRCSFASFSKLFLDLALFLWLEEF